VVLPHGYPCSSYQFRNLMPLLANHWAHPSAAGLDKIGEAVSEDGFRDEFSRTLSCMSSKTPAIGLLKHTLRRSLS
jgi:hypothetical protein